MVGRAGRDRRHLDRDVVSDVPFRTPASAHVVGFIVAEKGLLRREFSPTEYRNHDADQRRQRTKDGPGRGAAHLTAGKHAESLQRPDQTEQCEEHPNRECNDESPFHMQILRAEEGTSRPSPSGAAQANSG